MDCPYCKKMIEPGYITSSRRVFYSKSDGALGLGMGFGSQQEIMLDSRFWQGSTIKAFYCNDCRKLIINLDDNERVRYPTKSPLQS